MKKGTLLILVIFFSFILNSFACDCDGVESPIKESLAKSANVFVGKVISIKKYKSNVSQKVGHNIYYIIEFQTEEIFKGKKTKTVSLITESTSCGGDFNKGQSYLIFTLLNKKENKLEYHQCFRMSLTKNQATEDIKILREKN